MITELTIDKEQLKRIFQDKYGLDIISLIFQPMGEVSWSYIVVCKNTNRYFLKIHKSKELRSERIELLFNLYTKCNITNIPCPIKTIDENLEVELASYSAVLFPYIDGTTAFQQKLTPEQLEELGELLARIHYSKEIIGAYPIKEEFMHRFRPGIEKIYHNIEQVADLNQPQRKTKQIYQQYKQIFLSEMKSLEHLGQELQNKDLTFVNCHGEPSEGNIMISKEGELYLLDWDEPIFAPKEKDLMFFSDDYQSVKSGYETISSDADINKEVLRYYLLLWNVGEIEDWGRRIFFEEHPLEEYKYYLDKLQDFLDYSGLNERI